MLDDEKQMTFRMRECKNKQFGSTLSSVSLVNRLGSK